jgi:hypothetical protein
VIDDTYGVRLRYVPADAGWARKECTVLSQPELTKQLTYNMVLACERATMDLIYTLQGGSVLMARALAKEAAVLKDADKRRQAAKLIQAACLRVRALGRSITGTNQKPDLTGTDHNTGAFELISKMQADILDGSIIYPEKVYALCSSPTTYIILHGVLVGALNEMARTGLITQKDAVQLTLQATGNCRDLVDLAWATAITSVPIVLLVAQNIRLGEVLKERMAFLRFLAMVEETTRQSPVTSLRHACAELLSRSYDRPIQLHSAGQWRPEGTRAPDDLPRSMLRGS